MLGAGAAGIDILDPQQEGAVALAREIVGEQRRISVAEMQPSGRAWREAGDRLHRTLLLTASRDLWCHDGVTQCGESVADTGEDGRTPDFSLVLGATGFEGGVSRRFLRETGAD